MSENPAAYGALYGSVVDAPGDPLPGVVITISKASFEIVQESNAIGEFRFLGLEPGTYTVTAEMEGFKTYVNKDVNIEIGRDTVLQITLQFVVHE